MYTHKFHKIINLTIYNAFWYFLLSYSLSLKQNKMVVIDEDSSPVLSLQTVVIDKYDPIFYFQTDLPWCAFSCVLSHVWSGSASIKPHLDIKMTLVCANSKFPYLESRINTNKAFLWQGTKFNFQNLGNW